MNDISPDLSIIEKFINDKTLNTNRCVNNTMIIRIVDVNVQNYWIVVAAWVEKRSDKLRIFCWNCCIFTNSRRRQTNTIVLWRCTAACAIYFWIFVIVVLLVNSPRVRILEKYRQLSRNDHQINVHLFKCVCVYHTVLQVKFAVSLNIFVKNNVYMSTSE